MDGNKVVTLQAAEDGKSVHDLEKENQLVHLGWTSDILNMHVDVLWEELETKARSPEKFMDVSDVKVSAEDGFLCPTL